MRLAPSPQRRSAFRARFTAAWLFAWASLCTSGCVTVYQPMVALQQPVVVEPRHPNLEGLKLLVRCVPGDDLSPADAQQLCRRLHNLFRNQGADVEQEIPRNGRSSRIDEGKKPELVLEVRSRLVHHEYVRLLTVLSWFTLTLVPIVEEWTFAQDVTVRAPDGSVLGTDAYQARFIEYFGVGVWGVNKVLDLLVRQEEDKLTGDVANKDFSRDFYGQLSQLLFNARVRAQVLRGFEPLPAGPSPVGG